MKKASLCEIENSGKSSGSLTEVKKESRISHPFILKQHMRVESPAERNEQFCSISF